ncbi:pre-peptidase C-terminal domain-containing protein [Flavobacterium sp. RHBU_3]|uniref:pre-peptidase C-terminal domain-containing protein n=1 Tax=Flavobacterium sp. RHBU_3 TaxID=3391184 RepID=UPI003984B340
MIFRNFKMSNALGKYTVLLFMLAVIWPSCAQVIVDQQSFSGSTIPSGWTGNNIIVSGGYAKFATVGSSLTTPSYNLSVYGGVTLSFELANETASAGGPITINISSDGGASWNAQTMVTPSPSGVFFLSYTSPVNVYSNNVKINFSKQEGSGPLKFRTFKIEGVYQPQLMLNGSLTEDTVAGATIVADLTVGNFAATLDKNYFSLVNAPSGLSIASVTKTSDVQAVITLASNNTDFDVNYDFGVSIAANQTLQGYAVTSFNTVPLLAHLESLSFTPLVRSGLNYLVGNGPSIAKTFTISAADVAPGPGGVTIYGNTYYEVSVTGPTTGFGSTAVITYDSANAFATNVFYVRLKAGLAAGTYNTQAITVVGGKATVQMAVNGKVIGSTITNDTCASAESLESFYGNITGSLAGSTYTALTGGDSAKDVWYKFYASCPGTYSITLTGSNGNADLFLFNSACPSSLLSAVASAQTTNQTEVLEYFVPQSGNYYIRVAAMDYQAEGGFLLDFHKLMEAPVVSVGGAVNSITTSSAVISAAPQVSCGSTGYGIEYSVTSDFEQGTGSVLSASGLDSGSYSLLLSGLSAGTTYYFRVWETGQYGTGYGPLQSFTTGQTTLGQLATEAPVAQLPTNVTIGSFRSRWFDDNDYNFKLDVSTSPTFDTTLLTENFSGFFGSGTVQVTVPDGYFQQSGWSVDNVYSGPGKAIIGTDTLTGSVTTPALQLSGVSGDTFITFDLERYATEITKVQVMFSADGSTNWVQLGPDLSVADTAQTFVLPVTGGTASSKIKIQSTATAPGKRFYLDNVSVTNFSGTIYNMTYASLISTAQSAEVNGVSGLVFYRAVNSLPSGTTYYYRVRAESQGVYSVPSDVVSVSTLTNNIQNGILYVRKGQTGTGESWTNAMGELADALYTAKELNDSAPNTIRQIWVATGKYNPMYRPDNFSNADPNDRDNAFVLVKGVSIYGGFEGYETSINNRQNMPFTSTSGEAILSGKIGEEGDFDNSYHIILAPGLGDNSGVVVDGFVIRDAMTNGTGYITSNGYNIQRYNGGGVYNVNSGYELKNSIVEINIATGNGAGIYNENCGNSMVINTVRVKTNTATSGAGIANVNGSPVIKSAEVTGNTASASGGGIYNESSSASITDSSVSQNSAISGGGVYNIHTGAVLTNVVVSLNTADYGAGVYNAVSNHTLLNRVKLKDNSANYYGGALYVEGDTELQASGTDSFVNCLVTGNTASAKGGVLYYESGNNTAFSGITAGPVFTNCTFDANTAGTAGGFYYYDNQGAAVAPAVFRNSIIMSGTGSFADASASSGIDAAIFRNVLTDQATLGQNYNSGNNLLSSNPLFANASLEDYELDTDSPAVNAGDTDYYTGGQVPNLYNITTDYAGNDRVYDGFIDLGAYEWQEETPCVYQTVWDGTSWSNGEPDSIEYAAIFEGDFTSTESLTACSVTVNSGIVNILSGHSLKVKGAVTVNSGAQLIINNNAALVQVNNIHNTGSISVIKNANPLYRLDYTLWSSPVDGQSLGDFSPLTVSTRYYEYKYGYDGSDWVEVYWPIPGSTIFSKGKGYLIRMPNALPSVPGYAEGTASYVFTGTFNGVPNNGNVTVDLSTSAGRFTAVGNPYPSPISVADFFAANSGVLDEASPIYLWRKRNNSNATSYATLSLAGFVANPALGGGAGQAQFFTGPVNTWTLSQGQGFFVKTKSGVATPVLRFNNSMRRQSPGTAQAFLKSAQQDASVAKVWLNIFAEDGVTAAQTAIVYMDGLTTGIDYGYDGKMMSGGNVQIYSISDSDNFTIQGRPSFEVSDVVSVGYNAVLPGTYVISVDHTEGVFSEGQAVYLKDKLLNTIHEITTGEYSFVTEAGTFDERFEIIYSASALSVDDITAPQLNGVVVYNNNGVININAGTLTITDVKVYDIRGRVIYTSGNVNNTKTQLSGLAAQNEVLLVEIATDKGKTTRKVIF